MAATDDGLGGRINRTEKCELSKSHRSASDVGGWRLPQDAYDSWNWSGRVRDREDPDTAACVTLQAGFFEGYGHLHVGAYSAISIVY